MEVGAGTGLLTPLLAAVWRRVVSLDLTPEMMRRSRAPGRLIADASRLPLLDDAAHDAAGGRRFAALTAEAGWGLRAVLR